MSHRPPIRKPPLDRQTLLPVETDAYHAGAGRRRIFAFTAIALGIVAATAWKLLTG